ncbi:RNA polymerase factor sigma-54 [Rhodovulum adriaticum]|uniref:RNA polymerase sigma-54 factor n=1 Tax=Rhodovulum adriaticum TaxID=35804 RepID=A0A4R2NI93_RHOAD|nr:RNA polymerase factor sigma-54 [Rhodovulum adriaticum]MBK1635846.1 RNA polymerase sigma-54 factor [Rhodovulum adriaticum]TCP20988.1 RNA polymerase RpoN-/SigL-like sigma 54 subunit [Rhodovulum adriaticum]
MEMMLTQRQTQGLAMTARMQASLKILQMSNLDLSAHLAEEALSNPCLDVKLPEPVPELPSAVAARGADWDPVAALASGKPSLYDHVARQIALAFSSPTARRVADAFAEALEPTGWLSQPVEAIAAAARVPLPVAQAVLDRMRQFEPAGLFARDLADCLKLQAEDRGLLTWELTVILDNLPMIADGRIDELADLCDGTPDDVRNALRAIRGLDPKPGLAFAADPAPILPPDLRVVRKDGAWVVELNHSTLPAITVRDAPDPGGDAAARSYGAQALSRARWLRRTVERRQSTLLRAAAALVRRQETFLEKGQGHLAPLTTQDLAEEMNLHPSTISRAVAGRLIETPRGTLPLRAFFSRAFTPGSGDTGPSQDAVIAVVGEIVRQENARKPLSDAAIVREADKRGVTLARRTVAKYREMLGIPSSYDRRQRALAEA